VDELRAAGAIFIEELDEVPAGHGLSSAPTAFRRWCGARRSSGSASHRRHLSLVTKVHLEAVKFARKNFTIVLIGHKDHDEVIGTLARRRKPLYSFQTWTTSMP